MMEKKISRRSVNEWRKIVEGYAKSGMKVMAYCARHGISDKSYYYWKRRFGQEPASEKNDFIKISGSSETDKGVLRIKTPGGFQVEVPEGMDSIFVKDIIAGLGTK
jgi:transposase